MTLGNFENRVREVLSRRGNANQDIIAEEVGGSTQAYQVSRDDDIFAVVNDVLEDAGEFSKIEVDNGEYTKASGKAPEIGLESKHEGQTVDFQNCNIQLDDGADVDMISINHDLFKVKNGTLRGNKDNNDIQAAIKAEDVSGFSISDVDVSGAENGILLDNVIDGDVKGVSGSVIQGEEVSNGILVHDSNAVNLINTVSKGFTNAGIKVENSSGILGRLAVIRPGNGEISDYGVHIVGGQECDIECAIVAQGLVDVGYKDEPFDVGGDNETISTANHIQVEIQGVNDIGVHISDAEKETVRGLINGDVDGDRTNQAFLVDSPNDLANAQHDINLSGVNLQRITDTDQTGTNVGMRISGHYSKVNETSTIGAGGNSELNFKYGQALPRPVVETKSGTSVTDQRGSKKESTGPDGQVSINWSNFYAYGDKPLLNVSLETAAQWYVDSYDTDDNGRYTGATIQVVNLDGTAVGNKVDVNVQVMGS